MLQVWRIYFLLSYHFCLNLPAAFTQPGASSSADLCSTKTVHYSTCMSNFTGLG